MILSAQSIRRMRLVSPFRYRSEAFGMTYGLGPAGYDIRAEFEASQDEGVVGIPSGGFRLASSIEHFYMPDDILGIVHDKSSWARLGLAVQNTVIEPGWRGYLTIELSNHADWTIQIPVGSPIAQIIFHRLDEPTDFPYSGKYQNQDRGPQKAK